MFTDLGRTIRALREEDPWWSQQDLADRADVSMDTVVRAEAGKNLRFANLSKLAAALKEKTGKDLLGNFPSTADERLNAAQDSSIVGPSRHPTRTEGAMQQQIDRLLQAFGIVPTAEREEFIEEVQDLAAQKRLRSRGQGTHPGNRRPRRRTG